LGERLLNIKLPDGTLLQDVPEGTTREQIRTRLKGAGLPAPPLDLKESVQQGASLTGQSFLEAGKEGLQAGTGAVGQGLGRIGEVLKSVFGSDPNAPSPTLEGQLKDTAVNAGKLGLGAFDLVSSPFSAMLGAVHGLSKGTPFQAPVEAVNAPSELYQKLVPQAPEGSEGLKVSRDLGAALTAVLPFLIGGAAYHNARLPGDFGGAKLGELPPDAPPPRGPFQLPPGPEAPKQLAPHIPGRPTGAGEFIGHGPTLSELPREPAVDAGAPQWRPKQPVEDTPLQRALAVIENLSKEKEKVGVPPQQVLSPPADARPETPNEVAPTSPVVGKQVDPLAGKFDTVSLITRARQRIGEEELRKRGNILLSELPPEARKVVAGRPPEAIALETAARLTVADRWESRETAPTPPIVGKEQQIPPVAPAKIEAAVSTTGTPLPEAKPSEVSVAPTHPEAREAAGLPQIPKIEREDELHGFKVTYPNGAVQHVTRAMADVIANKFGLKLDEPERPTQVHSNKILNPATNKPVSDGPAVAPSMSMKQEAPPTPKPVLEQVTKKTQDEAVAAPSQQEPIVAKTGGVGGATLAEIRERLVTDKERAQFDNGLAILKSATKKSDINLQAARLAQLAKGTGDKRTAAELREKIKAAAAGVPSPQTQVGGGESAKPPAQVPPQSPSMEGWTGQRYTGPTLPVKSGLHQIEGTDFYIEPKENLPAALNNKQGIALELSDGRFLFSPTAIYHGELVSALDHLKISDQDIKSSGFYDKGYYKSGSDLQENLKAAKHDMQFETDSTRLWRNKIGAKPEGEGKITPTATPEQMRAPTVEVMDKATKLFPRKKIEQGYKDYSSHHGTEETPVSFEHFVRRLVTGDETVTRFVKQADPPETPGSRIMGGIPIPSKEDIGATGKIIKEVYNRGEEKVKKLLETKDVKGDIDILFSRIKQRSWDTANQVGNALKTFHKDPEERKAGRVLVDYGFDKEEILKEAERLKEKAPWAAKLFQSAAEGQGTRVGEILKGIMQKHLALQKAFGVDTPYRENYFPITSPYMPDPIGEPTDSTRSLYRKPRSELTLADRILLGQVKDVSEDNPSKGVVAIDPVAGVKQRLYYGYMDIEKVKSLFDLKKMKDPITEEPVVADMVVSSRKVKDPETGEYTDVKDPSGRQVTPSTLYRPVKVFGRDVAVLSNYEKMFKALTSEDAISQSFIGEKVASTAASTKASKLVGDFFHLDRITAIRMAAQVSPKGGIETLVKAFTGKTDRPLALAEFGPATVRQLVKEGSLSEDDATWIESKRGLRQEMVNAGYKSGGWIEQTYGAKVKNLPGVKQLSHLIFNKVGQAALEDVGIEWYERNLKNFSERMERKDIAKATVQELESEFANFHRDISRNRTFNRAVNIMFLAHQWFRKEIQTEYTMGKQAAQMVGDVATGNKPVVRNLLKAQLYLMAAGFVAAQFMNYLSRHQFTWENKEKGHKFDALIPGTDNTWVSSWFLGAPITTTLVKYHKEGESGIESAIHLIRNKLGPVVEAGRGAVTGKTFYGKPVGRLKATAAPLIPVPLGASQLLPENYGGPPEGQRSIAKALLPTAGIRSFTETSSDEVKAYKKGRFEEYEKATYAARVAAALPPAKRIAAINKELEDVPEEDRGKLRALAIRTMQAKIRANARAKAATEGDE
jgi:hypothetical protein